VGKVITSQMLFCCLTNSGEALKETKSTDPNQWPGLIISFIYHQTPGGRGAGPFTPAPIPVTVSSFECQRMNVYNVVKSKDV